VESGAKKAESKVKGEKIKNKPLTMKAIREEAHKIAAGHMDMPSAHPTPKHSSSHTTHKKKVTVSHSKGPHGNNHVHVHVHKSKDKKVQVHSHGVSASVHQQYADKVKRLEKERLAAKAKGDTKLVAKLARQQQAAVENAVNHLPSA